MRICKFKPLTKAQEVKYIEELMDGIFHLADWTNLNDIWEGVYRINPVTRNGLNINESCEQVGAKLYAFKKRFWTYSFSMEESGDKDILRNHCMWAHYASNHRGVVVEYEIPDSRCENFAGLREDGYCFTRIKYSSAPKMLTLDEIDMAENDVEGQKIFDLARALLSKKIKDWEYENEVRLIALGDCGRVKQNADIKGVKHLYFHSDLRPRRIITGSRYFANEENLRVAFEEACDRHGIKPVGISTLEEYQAEFVSEEDYNAFGASFYHA